MELRGNNAVAGCGGLDFGFYFAFQCGVRWTAKLLPAFYPRDLKMRERLVSRGITCASLATTLFRLRRSGLHT
jgi:hypothetical protein